MHLPGWSLRELTDMVRAATGWDVSEYELLKVGERAMTLARVFNMREGLTADDDRLCERSYGPRAAARWPRAASTRRNCSRPCTPTMA